MDADLTALTSEWAASSGGVAERDRLERLFHVFRAAVPCARGVVLATVEGDLVAHDLPSGTDARSAAREASKERRVAVATPATGRSDAGVSAFVEGPDGLTLVVFVDRGFVLSTGRPRDASAGVDAWTTLDAADAVSS